MSRDDGIWVGIDVSKDSLDVGALPSGQIWSVTNDEAGVVQLLAEFGPAQPTLIVMEATGGYEMLAALSLSAAGIPVAVVNPRQARDFAKAMGRLAKTDKVDAAILALCAERMRPARPRPGRGAAPVARCRAGYAEGPGEPADPGGADAGGRDEPIGQYDPCRKATCQ